MQPAKRIYRLNCLHRVPDILSACVLLGICILLILYRDAARSGVFTGVYTCLNTLVPSLFPFVLLSCITVRSNSAALLFRPLSPVMRYVFRLPAAAAPALLLGLTAGYPTGAKITAALYENGTLDREQAARLLSFCTAPGYAFCVYTAACLSRSQHEAMLLFFATSVPPLLIGFIRSKFAPKPKGQHDHPNPPFDFSDAVRDGVSAMVSMCGFIVVFSALLSVFQVSGIFRAAVSLLSLSGLPVSDSGALLLYSLEVTAGVTHCTYWHLSLNLTAFGLGFAGLCIHLQLFSFFRGKLFPMSKAIYILYRFLHAVAAAALCSLLTHSFPVSASVFAGADTLSAIPAGSPALSAALLGLSVFFLLICSKESSPPKKT